MQKLSKSLLIFSIVSLAGGFLPYFLFDAYIHGRLRFEEDIDYGNTTSESDATTGNILPNSNNTKKLRVIHWRPNLEVIDNRRIFMHKTSEDFHLSARQSCSVESAAKHNPDRPIQVYMRRPKSTDFQELLDAKNGNSTPSAPWIAVLQNYANIEVILIDEREYFNKTVLASWYSAGKWRKSPQRTAHLSEYIRTATLFKGGGLFLDLDSVVTIKPLAGPKFRNFFIKRNLFYDDSTVTTSEMMHLLHGHHLIDEIILNMAEYDYNSKATAHAPLSTALDTSVKHICGGLNDDDNKCRDVHLLEAEDVFLPKFESPFWRSILPLLTSKNGRKNKEAILEKAIETLKSTLLRWEWLTPLNHLYGRSSYETLFSILLMQHCPLTISKVANFPMPAIIESR